MRCRFPSTDSDGQASDVPAIFALGAFNVSTCVPRAGWLRDGICTIPANSMRGVSSVLSVCGRHNELPEADATFWGHLIACDFRLDRNVPRHGRGRVGHDLLVERCRQLLRGAEDFEGDTSLHLI